jgi:hypothetical protein
MLAAIGGLRRRVLLRLIPGRPWVHLPITMGYDRYPERLIDEKRKFMRTARVACVVLHARPRVRVATPTVDAARRYGVTTSGPARRPVGSIGRIGDYAATPSGRGTLSRGPTFFLGETDQ